MSARQTYVILARIAERDDSITVRELRAALDEIDALRADVAMFNLLAPKAVEE